MEKAAAFLHDSTCTAAQNHMIAVQSVNAWAVSVQCRIMLLLHRRGPLQGCHHLSHNPALPWVVLHLLHHGGLDQQAHVQEAAGLQLRLVEVPVGPLQPTLPGGRHRLVHSPPSQPLWQCSCLPMKSLPSPGISHGDRMYSGD